jgi:hypothetical protein
MYAARPISAGEVVLHERPLALTVCRGARSYRCALCLSDSRAGAHVLLGCACCGAARSSRSGASGPLTFPARR